MKVCPVCNQTYRDDEQNYCLNDGSVLTKLNDDAPPTVFMNPPRPTEKTNWAGAETSNPWQNQRLQQQNQTFGIAAVQGRNQTLPTVSLVLGVLSFVLICCFGGIPFGISAIITGYIGLNNTNKDPAQFGGRGLAIAGMIIGGISLVGSLVFALIRIIGSIK